MKEVVVPEHYNYIGVFLTLRCNLNCDYCINKHSELAPVEELSTSGWIDGLARIKTRPDLPLSFQGGEPTTHPGFYKIVNAMKLHEKSMDLLTNGLFNVQEFYENIPRDTFRRGAKYASIRFSFHKKTHPMALAIKALAIGSGHHVGIWGVDHPSSGQRYAEMKDICKWLNIDYRVKEFIGWYDKVLYGTYKYPDALSQVKLKTVQCKPSELLINPAGYIFRCHADLYANRGPIGHILDKEVKFPGFTECSNYGSCNPCDVKLKTNRLQEGGHCSVEIKGKGVKEIGR